MILVSGLCFSNEPNLNRPFQSWPLGTEAFELTPALFDYDSSYLAQQLQDIEKARSLQRTGRLLIFGGGLLAVMGAVFTTGAKKFGGDCCEDRYRNWGYLFVGTGSALIVGGLYMRNKGKRLEGSLALHIDPAMKRTALGYRLAF